MNDGLSVGLQLEILCNVRRRLRNEIVSVGLKWSVKCRATKSECQCRPLMIWVGWRKMNLFFPRGCILKIIYFSTGLPFENYFFPGEEPPIFFFSRFPLASSPDH